MILEHTVWNTHVNGLHKTGEIRRQKEGLPVHWKALTETDYEVSGRLPEPIHEIDRLLYVFERHRIVDGETYPADGSVAFEAK